MSVPFLPVILFLCLFAGGGMRPASAFGVLGHQVIGALAEDLLTPKAKAEVKNILGPAGGSATLASISTWADDVRMLRPETRPWHYVTIQIGEGGYDSARADTPNVVRALNRQTAILARPDADRYAREEALKWVVHLIGDLHQPLHVGEDHDKGGNLAKVRVNRRGYNLHAVWDYVLLERLRLSRDSLLEMLEAEIAADTSYIPRNATGTVESWTDETHAKTAACYLLHGKRMRKGLQVQLDRQYLRTATLTTLEQLKLGGVRLAFTLNRALDPGSPSPMASRLSKPRAGWRDDKSAFFAQEDSIREPADMARSKDTAAAEAASPAKPAKSRGPRIPERTYAWSVHSQVYHHSACTDVARIKKKNLRSGDRPPDGMPLHAGCPHPR